MRLQHSTLEISEQISIDQFLDVARAVLTGSHLIDATALTPKEWENPCKVFFGDLSAPPLFYEVSAADADAADAIVSALDDLAHGWQVEIELTGFSKEQIMLIDALYFVIFTQLKDSGVDPVHTQCGMLHLIVRDSDTGIGEATKVVAKTIMDTLYSEMSRMYMAGNPHAKWAVDFIEGGCHFLLPVGNATTYVPNGKESDFFEIQSMINYDLFFAGLNVWYRIEKLVQTSSPAFSIAFDEAYRTKMDEFVQEVLESARRIAYIGEHLISEEGLRIFDDHIAFLSRLYNNNL